MSQLQLLQRDSRCDVMRGTGCMCSTAWEHVSPKRKTIQSCSCLLLLCPSVVSCCCRGTCTQSILLQSCCRPASRSSLAANRVPVTAPNDDDKKRRQRTTVELDQSSRRRQWLSLLQRIYLSLPVPLVSSLFPASCTISASLPLSLHLSHTLT